MLSFTALCLAFAGLALAQDTDIQTVDTALKNAGVIPDVLPANFTSRFPIEVVFSTNNTFLPVTAGMNLTMNETANVPNFAIFSNNTQIIGKPYLIAIVDPDAPSPPNRTEAQFLHFLGINYISQNITNGTLFILQNTSEPIMPFFPPTPPNGSVPHRYVVAMYLQASENVTVVNGTVPANRENFNLTTFANKTGNLTLLGATFFFVGPGNTTATNNASIMGNATVSSIIAGAGPTNTSPSGGGGGGALAVEIFAPAVWSVLAALFGGAIYFL